MSESRASAAPSEVSQDNAEPEEQIQPVVAVILAAGLGVRFDESNPKQLVQVGGKPIIAWSIDAFQFNARVTDILVVVNDRVREAVEAIVGDDTYDKVRTVIQGGIERMTLLGLIGGLVVLWLIRGQLADRLRANRSRPGTYKGWISLGLAVLVALAVVNAAQRFSLA